MSWYPCTCGHPVNEHFLAGTQRHGPCKGRECSCPQFQATGHPPGARLAP